MLFLFFFKRRIEIDLKSPISAILNSQVNIRSSELHHKQGRQDSISSDLSNLTIDSEGIIFEEFILYNINIDRR